MSYNLTLSSCEDAKKFIAPESWIYLRIAVRQTIEGEDSV